MKLIASNYKNKILRKIKETSLGTIKEEVELTMCEKDFGIITHVQNNDKLNCIENSKHNTKGTSPQHSIQTKTQLPINTLSSEEKIGNERTHHGKARTTGIKIKYGQTNGDKKQEDRESTETSRTYKSRTGNYKPNGKWNKTEFKRKYPP